MSNGHDGPDPFDILADLVGNNEDIDHVDLGTLFGDPPARPTDIGGVWEALETDASQPNPAGDATLVNKTDFCERCPFLSEPPALRCAHPGAELLAFPDPARVLVAGCPFASEGRRPIPGATTTPREHPR